MSLCVFVYAYTSFQNLFYGWAHLHEDTFAFHFENKTTLIGMLYSYFPHETSYLGSLFYAVISYIILLSYDGRAMATVFHCPNLVIQSTTDGALSCSIPSIINKILNTNRLA